MYTGGMAEITGQKLDTKFKSGDEWKGNPNGRPKGSISIVAKIKQKFEENPEYFDEWVDELLKDKNNRQAVMKQIDGMPKQSVDLEGSLIVNVVNYADNDTPSVHA